MLLANPQNQTNTQFRKAGRGAYKNALAGYQLLSEQEVQQLAQMFPQYAALFRNAMNSLSPGNKDARIAEFRNREIQTGAQIGKAGAAMARWGGLGSGAQEYAINDAMGSASDNISEFSRYVNSPEYDLQAMNTARGLFTPTLLENAINFDSAYTGAHPKKQKADPLSTLISAGSAIGGFL